MSFRVISGLLSANYSTRPKNLPKSRPRGAKAAGLRYERALAKTLPQARHGQWFQFTDRAGVGHCQTDLILNTELGLAVLEAKYTWTQEGHGQLEKLYLPILQRINPNTPVFGFVVCRVLTRETPRTWVCGNLENAIERAARDLPTVLHWIGGNLEPLRLQPSSAHLAEALCLG